jgi:AraC-like DNA-binding protein
MLYLRSGSLQLTVGDETMELQAGRCVLIPKETEHSYVNHSSEVAESLEIKFTLPQQAMDIKFSRYGVLLSDMALAGSLFEQIVREYSDLGAVADDAAADYLTALLQAMNADRRYARPRGFRVIDAAEYGPLSQQIIRYLEEHYAEDFSLDALASALGYNKSYLCIVFKRDTQITINDCLNTIRIRKAAELIAYSDNDLSRIAAMCGFSTVSHFNRVFLKHVGTTPGQCRRAYPMHVTMDPERRFLGQPDRFMYSVLARKQITPEMILQFEKKDHE